jgi:hypothetical protein
LIIVILKVGLVLANSTMYREIHIVNNFHHE